MFLTKPHEVELMRHVWENTDEGVKSLAAWQHLRSLADERVHRSRATVINFLNKMTRENFLVDNKKTGKGGEHSVYYPSPDFPCEEAYIREMAMRMVKAAGDMLNVTFVPKQNPVN